MGRSEAARVGREPRESLRLGVLAFRWAALAWLVVSAIGGAPFRRPGLAVAAIAVAAAWTVVVSVVPERRVSLPRPLVRLAPYRPGAPRRRVRLSGERHLYVYGADLAIALGLVLVSGLVVPEGAIVRRTFFATAYPAAAVLMWATHGVRAGLIASFAIGAALVASRPIGGVPLGDLTSAQAQSLANGVITYLLAGGSAGFVSQVLSRAVEQRLRETDRAARLAERAALGRQIHDSVLQSLALVHKRGRELAALGSVDGDEVARLATLAGEQEQALRSLILRADVDPPQAGSASLRDHLEALALQYRGTIPVVVTAAGAAYLPHHDVAEIAAAVKQAIDNTVEHAEAARVTVFVDEPEGEGGDVSVSVRDDGKGFDPSTADGFGLGSMRGRIEDLGGAFTIHAQPGRGTEIEMVVPGLYDGRREVT